MADNNSNGQQDVKAESKDGEKIILDVSTTIKIDHKAINNIEVRDGGAVAIGKNAKIIITQESIDIPKSVWWKVQKPVTTFAGRTNELEELHNEVLRDNDHGTITAITGLGGMGKSELARMYAHLKGPTCFDGNVLWILAEDAASLANSFLNLAQYLGVDAKNIDTTARVERVYDVFKSRKSLFIFDNAETMSTVSQFLPVSNPVKSTPYVIITSQVTDWSANVMLLQLDNLESYEAVCLIMNGLRSLRIDEKDAKSLANELHCFPLALQQAVSYIKKFNRRRRFTINSYIEAFQCKTKEVLNTAIPGSEYTKTVYVTWNVTFDRLKTADNYKLVMEVLATMALMHADDIPFSTFLEYASNDEDELWDVLEVLEQYSLIKQRNNDEEEGDNKEATFGIHRLVQKVLQLTLATEDILHHLDNALQQMQRFVLGGYGNYSRDKQFVYHAMHVWRHANEIEELRRRYCYLPIKIVDALLYQGRYRESLEYAEEQYEVLMDKLGQDHHSTLAMLFNKARAYHCISKHQDALVLYTEAIERQKEALGDKHCDTLASEIDLGFLHIDLEQPEISLKIFEEVYFKKKLMEQDKSVYGDGIELYKYRDIYTALYGIGHALQLLGRYDEAEEHYAIFYEQRRKTDGECHPRRLHAGNKLAEVKIKKGELSDAHALLQDVYAKQLKTLSDSHPHCMMTLANIIKCLKLKGEIEEARALLNELYDKRCEVLGPEHMDTKKIEKMIEKLDKEFPES